MEQSKFFSSVIIFLIFTIIAYILTVAGLSSVFSANVFNFSAFVQFSGYLGTILFTISGVPNFPFFISFYRSIFIIFLISSIIFLIYFVYTRNSNWSIVSFIFVIMIILMAALTPIFVELFDSLFMTWVVSPGLADLIRLIASFAFIGLTAVFLLLFIYSIFKKKMISILYFFLIIISTVFWNTFSQSYFPDFIFIIMDLSNLSLSIRLKPYIYHIILNLLYFSSLIPEEVQNIIGLLIYEYYYTPISTYLISPEFLSTFFALLFLEISLQTSYFQEIYFPTQERSKRLQEQIDKLERRIEKIKESKIEEEPTVEVHSISVRRFFSSEAFDYLREMMEKRKKLKKEQYKIKKRVKEELLDDDDAQHLQLYIEERFDQNIKAKKSLAAAAIFPNISKVLGSAVVSIIYRLITFIILTIILFNATGIFQAIGSPNIRISVELLSPTIISLVLFPMVLTFPVIGSIIKIRRFPSEEPKKSGIYDIGFGIMGISIGLIFTIIGAATLVPEFYWLSIPFWIFGGIELIYGIIQFLK